MRAEIVDAEYEEIDKQEEQFAPSRWSKTTRTSPRTSIRALPSLNRRSPSRRRRLKRPSRRSSRGRYGRIVLPDVPPDTMDKGAKTAKKKSTPALVPEPVAEAATDSRTGTHQRSSASAASREPGPASSAVGRPRIVMPKAPPKPTATASSGPRPDFRFKAGTTGFALPDVATILEGETQTTRIIDRAQLQATAEEAAPEADRSGSHRRSDGDSPRTGRHHVRVPAGGGHQAVPHRIALRRPGDGDGGAAGPHRRAHFPARAWSASSAQQDPRNGVPQGGRRAGRLQKSTSRLNMAVGKDIEGMPYVSDLAKMPHLLIAGTPAAARASRERPCSSRC